MTTVDIEVEVAAQKSLRLLGYYDDSDLIDAVEGIDHDVLVVGGGQTGITIAYALRRAGVRRVSVIDATAEESERAWRTKARMRALRTAKTVSGLELGVPALGFEAWYEGIHGPGAFDDRPRISRPMNSILSRPVRV
ncbi:FAD-dependent monooxygenase [Gordonia sp. ABSL1-1]|uniref:FAD-dependent oxidoreductase n=1 Tax=Gordonia sp. ABSL1-1 TaxID=3053923 RepID=UPI0025724ACB|nr:FAD-dependent oxidoreductase [Gordonia sp. ABSL1-1]MDL9937795.1 FAD-dependent monooxygenase [Gordonia sp. ABSL1-1]